jgi:hypothetical protein
VGVGDEKQEGKNLCSYDDLNKVTVSVYIPENGKIKKSQTEKKEPRLPDKEKILYLCREKQIVEEFRKKEDENAQEQTVQPCKQDEYKEMLYLPWCGTYFFKDISYQL